MDRSDIIILLDRSGSMQALKADHEGGLRSFAQDAQRLAGDVRLTFVRFDSMEPCEVVFEARPMADVDLNELTLTPRGGTPLLDAVGMTLSRFASFPAGTVVMVITDGEENESHEWTKARVQSLVKAREAAGWKVLYLGANVDEFAEAGAMGVGAGTTMGYAPSAAGTRSMYRSTGANMMAMSRARAQGMSVQASMDSLTYTAEQRAAAQQQTPKPKSPKSKDKDDDKEEK